MLLVLLTLAAAAPQTGPVMAGPAFERFALATDHACPLRHLRLTTPGELSWEQDAFEARLSRDRRQRLALANDQERRCAGHDGLSCSTSATLDALDRAAMLAGFARFACAHVVPATVVRHGRSILATAASILQNLDLNSFANSTGPRRQRQFGRPASYGFTQSQNFDDGWAEISEPDDRWHLSALLLDRGEDTATICFVDAGGQGATYRATQVLHVQRLGNGRWVATQIADRPDCHNDPHFPANTPAEP